MNNPVYAIAKREDLTLENTTSKIRYGEYMTKEEAEYWLHSFITLSGGSYTYVIVKTELPVWELYEGEE